jgi:hypothetical protein
MNTVVDVFAKGEDFYAPANFDLIDGLISQHKQMKTRIESVAEFVAGDMGGAINYFLVGNKEDRYSSPSVDSLFQTKGALAYLNASFWSKALSLTDVLELMPQKRRDEWHQSIEKRETPEFEEATVRSTLEALMSSRAKFFAERVDGIFRSLSHEHVTNCPQGFSKRMILGYVLDQYSYTSHTQCGHINDLRSVIAKFMGRDAPRYNSSSDLVKAARRQRGQWMIVDGGAMRIRVYAKGTAHLEIHPDMAWRLNQILASIYPAAIPSEFRTKPVKKHKEFKMMGKPLTFAVIEAIENAKTNRNPRVFSFNYSVEKAVKQQAIKVFESIGGTYENNVITFDYDTTDVIDEIVASGCIPDQQAHQYYPTPLTVAEEVIITADIQAGESCLEPSAGQGGLADLMPKEQTLCVEISELHCKILEAKGHTVVKADFLGYQGKQFDKIVMNPPYSEGRWQAHIKHASTMLKPNGALIAVLPSSAKNKDVLLDFKCSWSREFKNEFENTSIAVVIMKAVKA